MVPGVDAPSFSLNRHLAIDHDLSWPQASDCIDIHRCKF
jgi:hypothetical protein